MGLLRGIYLAYTLTAVVASSETHKARFDWDAIRYVYAFGDSYTFVQGTQGHANFSFIGDALDPSFTREQLLSNEIISKNTSSDGSNWIEFLTGCFQGRPSECSTQLWDFAFAGADIDGSLLPLHHDFTIPLADQVKQWASFVSKVLPKPPAETLTAWWIGLNDTGDTLNNATISDFTAFWRTEIESLFRSVNQAYEGGLSGAHLFINVPPEGRSPAHVGSSTGVTLKGHIDLFNEVLSEHVDKFAATHPSASILRFDANAWFNEVLDHHEEYGFKNVTGFCHCPESGYFWYDSSHPTERVYELLADAIKRHLQEGSSK
ncbi:putative lysophospholipase [Pleurotus eryngii]|uniref:Lysophospholipase n=1 Tax=Pleurotus eryngii TaxID=5323 RepID=A0A9P6A4N7_PLEER|nr:putative lysophospholipase [Pleurotus eryngii]